MMIGEGRRDLPAIHVPPWPAYEESLGGMAISIPAIGGGGGCSPYLAFQRFLPSNDSYISDEGGDDSDLSRAAPVDAYSCDEFRMYEFKVRRCARGRSHDWTECPYAHPGEKARRRDPRKYSYSGTACPDFRKGNCKRGDACEFAHGVFECWLHPTRYRTQPCKDGTGCRRRVCFFAHTADELRVSSPPLQSPRTPPVIDSYDGSPLRQQTLESPPLSPESVRSTPRISLSSMNDVLLSLRQLHLNNSLSSPSSWGIQSVGISSPRGFSSGFSSLPATPTSLFDSWDVPTERVESGRDLRAKMYEKLSKENSLARQEPEIEADVDWVSDLVK